MRKSLDSITSRLRKYNLREPERFHQNLRCAQIKFGYTSCYYPPQASQDGSVPPPRYAERESGLNGSTMEPYLLVGHGLDVDLHWIHHTHPTIGVGLKWKASSYRIGPQAADLEILPNALV